MASLERDKREVFVLYEVDGRPMREVADVAACPVPTAYARLYAARRCVAAALRRHRAAAAARDVDSITSRDAGAT
ncbi:MAG: sigma factor-like helix-turn-helix DNA-binding protein [Polyangiales bacterium]